MFQLSVAGRPRDLPSSHTDSHQVIWGGGVHSADKQKKINVLHFNQILWKYHVCNNYLIRRLGWNCTLCPLAAYANNEIIAWAGNTHAQRMPRTYTEKSRHPGWCSCNLYNTLFLKSMFYILKTNFKKLFLQNRSFKVTVATLFNFYLLLR
jgi:hypothetical protein